MNGSGKSTLFKSIMGFVKPTTGRVLINGCPSDWCKKENMVAYVPQSEEVDWNFPVSVWDVVMGRYGYMNVLRIPSPTDRRIVAESLEGANDRVPNRQIGELSGGQRNAPFSRALAQQGTVMLLDEPLPG